ncbi:superoxide dismutase family protein [Vibrio diabolicus]|uniref:superoxide dismutase family protein n=1 Tax=Vibrio diabolicus TaxID=50719 RepID=UPI0027E446DB|nr:superoxide dismutase family protein [Vibrio diabolicus]MCE9831132.1 superoxide dismutase family protein [Vibrio diabolicus]
MLKGLLCISVAAILVAAPNVLAQTVAMTDLNSKKSAGTIEISQSDYGVVFMPQLSGLSSGVHGFHVHTNPSCDSAEKNGKTVLGGAAGGHYDPSNTGKHGYPWTDDNHLGDLPPLYVDMDGNANQPVVAPRLKLSDLKGRALMIHAGGDNHSDHPAKLGGGGARVVCGVIK